MIVSAITYILNDSLYLVIKARIKPHIETFKRKNQERITHFHGRFTQKTIKFAHISWWVIMNFGLIPGVQIKLGISHAIEFITFDVDKIELKWIVLI